MSSTRKLVLFINGNYVMAPIEDLREKEINARLVQAAMPAPPSLLNINVGKSLIAFKTDKLDGWYFSDITENPVEKLVKIAERSEGQGEEWRG